MISMYVTYAGNDATPFNREHWLNVHFPLVLKCWGPYGLERIGGFFPQGDNSGLIAIAHCVFRDEAAMHAALSSPETAEVMADVPLVTDVKPRRSVARPL